MQRACHSTEAELEGANLAFGVALLLQATLVASSPHTASLKYTCLASFLAMPFEATGLHETP